MHSKRSLPPVTPTELKSILDRAGLSYRDASRLLRLADETDARTVRRWAKGERPVSGPASIVLELLDTGELPVRYLPK
jgi:hypothetical protein